MENNCRKRHFLCSYDVFIRLSAEYGYQCNKEKTEKNINLKKTGHFVKFLENSGN